MMFSQLHARRKAAATNHAKTMTTTRRPTPRGDTSLLPLTHPHPQPYPPQSSLPLHSHSKDRRDTETDDDDGGGGDGNPDAPLSPRQRRPHRRTRQYRHHPVQQLLRRILLPLPRRCNRRLASGGTAAVAAVACFLIAGLFLGYLLVHHRHRKVIYHVLRDPVGHVWRYGGRAGFRHHFYSGPPRYVTLVWPSSASPVGASSSASSSASTTASWQQQQQRQYARWQAIQDTWGPAARAIYALPHRHDYPPVARHGVVWGTAKSEGGEGSHDDASSITTPTDKYAYPQLLEWPATEAHASDNGNEPPQLLHQRWQYTLRTIYHHINPDYLLVVQDTSFVIPPHVCHYLAHLTSSTDPQGSHNNLHQNQHLPQQPPKRQPSALDPTITDLFVTANAQTQDLDPTTLTPLAPTLVSRHTLQRLILAWEQPPEEPPLQLAQQSSELHQDEKDARDLNQQQPPPHGPPRSCVLGPAWLASCLVALGVTPRRDQPPRLHGASLLDQALAGAPTASDCCATDSLAFAQTSISNDDGDSVVAETMALFAVRQFLLQNPRASDSEVQAFLLTEFRHTPRLVPPATRRAFLAVLRHTSGRMTQGDC